MALQWSSSFGADAVQSTAPRRVEIVVVGSSDNLKWLADLVGQNSAPGASLHFSRVERFEPLDVLREGGDAAGTLRCWVDLRDVARARIYFAARAGKRFLLRDLELSGSFNELDRESLSQVLALSWSALLEDEQAGLNREQAQALLAKRAAASGANSTDKPSIQPALHELATVPAIAFRLQAFYAGQAFARQLPIAQGPGLSVSAGLQSRRARIALWLEGQYRFPQTEQGPQVGVRLESIATRAGLELSLPLGAAPGPTDREFAVRAGFGVDSTHLTPEPGTSDDSAALTGARWSTALAFTSSVGASLRLNRGAALAARLFVDVLPTRVAYELRVGGVNDAELSPWSFRPGLALAIETR